MDWNFVLVPMKMDTFAAYRQEAEAQQISVGVLFDKTAESFVRAPTPVGDRPFQRQPNRGAIKNSPFLRKAVAKAQAEPSGATFSVASLLGEEWWSMEIGHRGGTVAEFKKQMLERGIATQTNEMDLAANTVKFRRT